MSLSAEVCDSKIGLEASDGVSGESDSKGTCFGISGISTTCVGPGRASWLECTLSVGV